MIDTKKTNNLPLCELKLPSLKPEEAWLDRFNESIDEPLSERVKRLLYLPTTAYATSVYAHENSLSKAQKEYLLLLFRAEADKAFEIVYTQIQITVGNSPSERVGYLREFENWQKSLVGLLKKALDCIDENTWLQRLKDLTPDNNSLFCENRQEWEKEVRDVLRLILKLFNKAKYFHKFSDSTYEAMKLLRRGSIMIEITMERREWIYQAMKNIGMLPAHAEVYKNQNISLAKNESQIDVLSTIQSKLSKPVEELDMLIKSISSGETARKGQEVKLHKKPAELTDTESNILEALDNNTLKGPVLLKRAGYDYSSHYRSILSNLVKRRILDRNVNGYYAVESDTCQ